MNQEKNVPFHIEHKGNVFIFSNEKDYDLCTLPEKTRKRKVRRKIYLHSSPHSKSYPCVSINGKCVRIHQILAGHPLNKLMIDHLNGNTFDNRRENLKVVTRFENCTNKPIKTKYKRWVNKQKNGKYAAKVRIPLGTYETEEEAHQVALKFMKTYFKDIYINPEFLNDYK